MHDSKPVQYFLQENNHIQDSHQLPRPHRPRPAPVAPVVGLPPVLHGGPRGVVGPHGGLVFPDLWRHPVRGDPGRNDG
ncbi:hypothetical protein MTO96_044677 [Rhipicephalus appendiculatus]